MKQSFPELALLVTSRHEHGYFHIYAYPVVLGTEGRADSVRNVNEYSQLKGGWYLDDFRVYSQGNDSDRRSDGGDAARLYGHETHFDTSRVTLRDATRMAKTLKRLEAALERLNDTRGYAKGYGEYVARVAEALGTKRMVFVQRERGNGGWGHDSNDHAFVSLGDGRARIEALERKWAASLQPQAATA